MTSKTQEFCLRAWNGLSIETPHSWEAAVSGTNHLFFEEQFEALFEIRWSTATADSIDKLVKNSKKQIEDLSSTKLSRRSPPPYTKKILSAFEVHCFTWAESSTISVLFLFCKKTSTFILFQFFKDQVDSSHPLKLIKSLQCFSNDIDKNLWSIQDFKIQIPCEYELFDYNLAAGFTKLSFRHKKSYLHICRIAPAGQRLQQQNLKNTLCTLLDITNESTVTNGEDSVHYQRYPSIARQIIIRIQKKKPFCIASLWHVQKDDRILGIIMEGIRPFQQDLFNSIRQSYETFSLKK